MDPLSRLQKWYHQQCDGDWEHGYGINIETLDNPGWRLLVDLTGTDLATKGFARMTHQDPNDEDRWIQVWKADAKFEGACGPDDLRTLIEIFLSWAEPASDLE
jgi:hypothetical protein